MTAVGRLHVHLGPGRPGLVGRQPDRDPRAPGPGRRDDHARRDDDPGPDGRAGADGPRDERRRRADAARPRARPGDRRPARHPPLVALDLLGQPPGRRDRPRARRAAAAQRPGRGREAARRARVRARRAGAGARWSSACRRSRPTAGSARSALAPLVVGAVMLVAFVVPRAAHAARARRHPPLPPARLRRRGGHGLLRRRRALRGDAPAAPLLPGRARALGARRRACCSRPRGSARRSACRSAGG